jgi:hypothetical protein
MNHKTHLIRSGLNCGLVILTAAVVGARGGGGGSSASGSVQQAQGGSHAAPNGLAYTPAEGVYGIGAPIAFVPHNSGGVITHFSVSPELPPGLSLDPVLGLIIGTPAVESSAAVYTVTGSNVAGSTTARVQIEIKDSAASPADLHYSSDRFTFTRGVAIADLWPNHAGGAITTYSVNPSLPDGLQLDPKTGEITGAPTQLRENAMFTVTGTDGVHRVYATLWIEVQPAAQAPSNLTYGRADIVATVNAAITADEPRASGGAVTKYAVSPSLPEGLSINEHTGEIVGSPKFPQQQKSYAVTASNSAGHTQTTITIEVLAAPWWQPVSAPNEARSMHTATLLPNGWVLVTGGRGADGKDLQTSEIYDVYGAKWSTVKPMNHARKGASAFLLTDGKYQGMVLVAGGTTEGKPSSALELYDPTQDKWTDLTPIPGPRDGATITLAGAHSDKLMIAGGYADNGIASNAVDVFDWLPVGSRPAAQATYRPRSLKRTTVRPDTRTALRFQHR